jgi:hypothetical protein
MTEQEARQLGWGERSARFAAWRTNVDASLERIAGVCGDDLGDCDYAEWYDEGMTPNQAARAALRANRF